MTNKNTGSIINPYEQLISSAGYIVNRTRLSLEPNKLLLICSLAL